MQYLQAEHGYSQRRACRLVECNRATVRQVSTRLDDVSLRCRLRELAQQKQGWGYRMLGAALRLEGWIINHKRTYRIYKEEKLDLRPKRRKRIKSEKRGGREMRAAPNEEWSMDFASDVLCDGRTFRTLNVIDIFTRRCLAIETDSSLSGERVVRVMARLSKRHGKPKRLRIANGPEFRSHKLDQWAATNNVELHFIDPGKLLPKGHPQNGHIESFNGRFREDF